MATFKRFFDAAVAGALAEPAREFQVSHYAFVVNCWFFCLAGGVIWSLASSQPTVIGFMTGWLYAGALSTVCMSMTTKGREMMFRERNLGVFASAVAIVLAIALSLAFLWFFAWPMRLIGGVLGAWASFCMLVPSQTINAIEAYNKLRKLEAEVKSNDQP